MTNVLSQKAVLARLHVSLWAGRTTDQKVTGKILKEHNAKSHAGIFTKRLINKEALAEVNSAASEAVRYHRLHTQPWLDEGVRILPTALFLEYSKEMAEYKTKFDAASAAFLHDYKKYIGQAQELLGSMFNTNEYPTVDMMKEKFDMSFNFLPCPDAGDFRCDIDDKHLEQIQSALQDQLDDQMRTAIADSARKALEAVSRMAERLSEYKPPTKKGDKAENTFRDSLVENVREIAGLLPAFNITGDPKMKKLHDRITKELCAHEAETLRKDTDVRKKVAKSAKEITKAVEEFLA